MSTTTNTQTTDDRRIARLTIDAGKYLGLTAGETIDRTEVKAQAEANGYTSNQSRAMLEGESQTIEIPEQGDLFGDLWPDNSSNESRTLDNPCRNQNTNSNIERLPEPLDEETEDHYALHDPIAASSNVVAKERYLEEGEPVTAYEAVGQYFKRRTTDSTSRETQGFVNDRRGVAEDQYKRGMAIDRQCLDQFEDPTLTMLSLRVSPKPQKRLTLLDGLSEAVDHALYKLRRRLEKDADAPFSSDEWEYIVVFAGTRKRATPHVHILVYTDGDVSRDRFVDVVKWYVEKCPYAPNDMGGNSTDSDTISIRGNGPDRIPRIDSDSCKLREEVDGRNSQAAAYALPQLPHLGDFRKMEIGELLHSATHDAYAGSAFRASMPEDQIESRYIPSSNNPCRNQTDQPESFPHPISEDARDSLIQAVSQLAQIPTPEKRLETGV